MTDSDDTLPAAEELQLVLDLATAIYVAQNQRTSCVSMGVALRIAAAAVGAAQSRQLRELIAKAKIAPKEALLEVAEHEALFARHASSEITERMATFAHDLPIAPNRLQQMFVAAAPNRVWLADITYIATGEGWLYLAAVLDLATRKIVGWSMRDHMRSELPLAALMMAAQRQRPAEGLICHSDRGSQYASDVYTRQLTAMKAKSSMSRTACCYDNAPMESFFHTLKVELVHQRRWPTRDNARRDLFAYLERLLQSAADPFRHRL